METVTISPKFQIVIPKVIRENLDLHPGEKVQVILFNNRIEYIPVKTLSNMRGFLKGIDTNVERENDRI
ncbi:MAG: AbrB/MazE/SpoVT family DNA-binding domain-containing protein [Candidatus Marinimicrobia bacterium]|nr:AbrB/MazE/SpoVT family DNA-binding domain-containing protein [Candidatus Neomarinimicrobiota bacterium]